MLRHLARLPRFAAAPRRAFLGVLLTATALSAQGVVVAPPVLVMDHRTRTGAVELYNGGERPVEVRVELMLGFPATDSVGQFLLATPTTPPPGFRAATAWLEVFPARLTIAPGGRQTVRLLATPPVDLADGEYSSRLAITSRHAPVAAGADSGVIATELSVEVRAVTTVLYRKGAVRSALGVGAPTGIQRTGDTLSLRLPLTPGGSAAFLGTLRFELEDAAGRMVATHEQPVSLYVPVAPRFQLVVGDLASGAYHLRVTPVAARADLLPGQAAPTEAQPVRFPFVLPVR